MVLSTRGLFQCGAPGRMVTGGGRRVVFRPLSVPRGFTVEAVAAWAAHTDRLSTCASLLGRARIVGKGVYFGARAREGRRSVPTRPKPEEDPHAALRVLLRAVQEGSG